MAKRTCARKSARRAPLRTYKMAHLPQSRRYSYTPELLASGRRRYEETDETITSIAVDFGIHKTTLQRMANREGWLRHVTPARDLPVAARLRARAEALASQFPPPERGRVREGVMADVQLTPTRPPSPAASAGDLPLSGGGEESKAGGGNREPDRVAELLAAVDSELATVKAMRVRMKDEPQRPADADITARTLARLTGTLRDLQHMQRVQPQTKDTQDYDDTPADIDEFRNELARRIRVFVAGRRARSDAGGHAAAPVAEGG